VPKPPVFVPAPAKIQGPRVVRVEKEEVVNIGPPRNRGPRMQDSDSPSVTPAAPRGGRGVKTTKGDEEEESESAKKAKSGRSLSARRKGADGRRGEALEKLKEYTDADLLERQERLAAAAGYRAGVDGHLKKRERVQQAKTVVQKGDPVEIEEPITVRSLAAALGLKANDLIGKLMKQGVFATLNQGLEPETAESLALEWGLELKVVQEPTLEEELMDEFESREVDESVLVSRPPVVTILGHVDHGKTSLLDKIRNANVAAGEAGGITQHTAAWMVQLGEKRVTFIDTPGHQAFTAMRARGANMTDVIVLVVSAAEGVQPQTVESINHAKAAGVPIVVALNKIDRADANPDMVLGQLAKENLNPVEWGGDTEVIRTSAITGQGVKDLIDMLDYQAELLQLKTDPTAPVRGSVIESRMDEGLGAVATVLVQDGTLKAGDVLLCGSTYGRIRRVLNDRGEPLSQATASMPVVVSGLSGMPNAGDKVFQVEDLDRARQICEDRAVKSREKELASKTTVSLENLLDTIEQQSMKEVRLIIKADVAGSVETLAKTVVEASGDEVKIRVIHAAAGPISESDVELADASKAVIIGFNVVPDDSARAMAEHRRIEVRLYRVIYEILDDLKKAMSGMLEPEIREKHHGRAEVRQVFKVSKVGNIAGCMATEGHIQRGSKIRLIRNGAVVVEDLSLESLRRIKEDVKEVKHGFECGMKLAGYDDIKVGDIFEAYIRETIQRTL
jgi:translation initiation factor IF-2